MSCTSCHDPHYEPPAEERVSYYREKCLTCHGAHFAAKHDMPISQTAPSATCRRPPVPMSLTHRSRITAFPGVRNRLLSCGRM